MRVADKNAAIQSVMKIKLDNEICEAHRIILISCTNKICLFYFILFLFF